MHHHQKVVTQDLCESLPVLNREAVFQTLNHSKIAKLAKKSSYCVIVHRPCIFYGLSMSGKFLNLYSCAFM